MTKPYSVLLLFLCCAITLMVAPAYGQCPPASTPNPSISSSFTPDTSCLEHGDDGQPSAGDRKECLVACEHSYTTYCTANNVGNTYLWSVTGGTISSGQGTNCVTVLWGPAGPGTIAVVETTPAECSGKDSICVKIIDSPIAGFTASTSVCLNTPVYFNNTSVGATSYFWNFGDGNTSTLTNPVHSYTTPGTYTVTLVAFNDCNCSDSATIQITVSAEPGPQIECPATVCAFAKECYSTTPACPTAVYSWSVNGGTILGPSNTPNICVQWGAGPVGTVSLVVTGCGNVCPDTTTVVVPIISTSGPISGPVVVCPGDLKTYTLPTWPGTYYNWTLSGGGTIISGMNTQAITIQWGLAPGTYTLAANWNNVTLECSGSDSIQIQVLPQFFMSGPPGPFCLGTTTTYFANDNANWTVSGGNTFTGNGSNSITVTWSTPGTHTVTANVINVGAYCNPTVTTSATVVLVPPAIAITGPDTVCVGSSYQYSATPSGPGYTFQWSVTGGTIIGSPTANPVTVQWSSPGTISVQQVQVNPPQCPSAPISMAVSIFSTSNITGPTTVCMDQTSIFTAGGPAPGIDFQWSIVDGSGNPSSAGSITGGQGTNQITVLWHGPGGPAVVKLVVCGQTLTYPVTINPKPAPTIGLVGKVCDPGGGVVLTASGGFVSYLWSNGDTNQVTNISSSGTYSVTVTDAFGCTGTASIVVPVTPGPIASISTPDPMAYCLPATINTTLHALQGTGYTYVWYPGAISTGATATYTVPGTGSYYVVVTDANGCTATSNTITVSATNCPPGGCTPQPYTLDFTATQGSPNCNMFTFDTTGTSNVSGFSWSFGDGNTSGSMPASHTYSAAGYYTVQLCGQVPAVSGGFCPVCTTKSVAVPLAAKFSFVNNCGTVTFTDHSTHLPGFPITSYSWSFPGGSPSSDGTSTPPPVTYSSPGTYYVTLTVMNGSGCTVSKLDSVVIPAPPSAAFTLPPSACVGVNVPLSGTGAGIVSWSWNFGDTATSNLQNTSHAWSTPGTYNVSLTVVNAAGCSSTVMQSITINPPAIACAITPAMPPPVCYGDSVMLTATAGASYQWYLNDTLIVGATSQIYYALQTGSYKVTVYDANGCPCTTAPVNVIVNPPPIVNAQTDKGLKLCDPGLVLLSTYNDPTYTYQWTQLSGPTVVLFTPTTYSTYTQITVPGAYFFEVLVTDSFGCTALDSVGCILYPPVPLPTITTSGLTMLCKGDSVTLTSSYASGNMWNTGDTTQSITVSTGGTYTVTYTAPNGCTASASIPVQMSIADFSLFPFGCDTLCDSAQIAGPIGPYLGYYSYQWQLNGLNIAPPSGTNQQLSTTSSGTYSLILTGPGPAFCVDTSGSYQMTIDDCGDTCKSKICGRKWHDKNGNGKFNYGTETGIPNWKICLIRCNVDGYPSQDTVACTTTDSLGYFCFENVCPGCYIVAEVQKPGWAQTWPKNPPWYQVIVGDSTIVMGLDFGNKWKKIKIWSTVDTIGVPPVDILPPDITYPEDTPWPYTISYSSNSGQSWEQIFKGIVAPDVEILPICRIGHYKVVRGHRAGYESDRIYVNGVLAFSDGTDSVIVEVPDSTSGIDLLFLNVPSSGTAVPWYRTFTAAQLAQADQAKPIKRPRPKKPIPMPNTANVIDELYKQQGIIVVGLPDQLNAGQKVKGYLMPAKQADVYKTFNTKTFMHTGAARGIDFDVKGKPILKRQKSIPANKHNNKLLANMLALRLNIVASEMGKTPIGFGDLVFLPSEYTGPLDPKLAGTSEDEQRTVAEIADMVDSIMTNWEGVSYQRFADFNALVESLNTAFSEPLPFGEEDTLHWVIPPPGQSAGKLVLTGVRPLTDVPYLVQVSGMEARTSYRDRIAMLKVQPEAYELGQNYPNPFNPSTTIEFSLDEEAYVSLRIFNTLGQEVGTILSNELLDAGSWEYHFDAGVLSSGVYFYQISVETLGDAEEGTSGQVFTTMKKMVLMK